jgi:hypothetical protein
VRGASTQRSRPRPHRGAGAILGLDVPDLDLPGKRGRIISKGRNDQLGALADRHRHAAAPAPGRRREGPVFLTARKPVPRGRLGDLCPVTVRARLSERRAAESVELATRPLANPGASHEELEDLHG